MDPYTDEGGLEEFPGSNFSLAKPRVLWLSGERRMAILSLSHYNSALEINKIKCSFKRRREQKAQEIDDIEANCALHSARFLTQGFPLVWEGNMARWLLAVHSLLKFHSSALFILKCVCFLLLSCCINITIDNLELIFR